MRSDEPDIAVNKMSFPTATKVFIYSPPCLTSMTLYYSIKSVIRIIMDYREG